MNQKWKDLRSIYPISWITESKKFTDFLRVDNISVLEQIGFSFVEGVDIKLSTGMKSILKKDVHMDEISKLGHYTFFLFSKY